MGRTGSDIARLLAQSDVDGFEYRDFTSAFDMRLEEKLKTMTPPVEVPADVPLPTVAIPSPVLSRPPQQGMARGEAARRTAPSARIDRSAEQANDRPIDALFHRLATGGSADQKLPALFARLR